MKKQSTRRMLVAQKKQLTQEFWHWFLSLAYARPGPIRIGRLAWNVELQGSLPGYRRLAKLLTVNVAWDDGEWLISEPAYHIHAAGPTLTHALIAFRSIFSEYRDVLAEHKGPMSQHLHEQLAYLQEMTEESTQA